jgi:hypothetical protein
MKRSTLAALTLGIVVALLVAGCGGGSEGGSNSTAPSEGGATVEGGAPKKATAPNVPAGSKVIACKEGETEAKQLRATAIDCGTARATMRQWQRSHACTLGKSASRSSCSLGTFRCQAARVDAGAAVSCAHPGGDVAWIAKAWPLKKDGVG